MRRLVLALLWLAPAPLAAQPVVVSGGPEAVAVSIYRDPGRGPDRPIDLDYLGGFALITETRTVELPPGRVTIRFEGVASGILPESAILVGPEAAEKNQDRRLLSEAGLLDAFTGQRVTVKRTDRATGRVTEEPGTIRSGSNGVVLQTRAGFEALSCTGLAQTLVYPSLPPDLSARPTLSVLTAEQPGGRVTLTLAYLASNFDWQANYVAELSPDARTVDLFAWLTMASADSTSFERAQANAIAGRVARAERDGRDYELRTEPAYVRYNCWPMGTTSSSLRPPPPPPPPPPPAPVMLDMAMPVMAIGDEEMSIVVTGSRIARREDLGDLKLYRIPMPVTVAANSQKQVAFLDKPGVAGELVYRAQLYGSDADEVELLYRLQNKPEAGLGEPLPGGQVALFQDAGGRRALVGESRLDDKAVGEEIDLVFGEADNVTLEVEEEKYGKDWERLRLVVRNANPFPVSFEGEFATNADYRYDRFGGRVVRKPGKTVWRTTVPANGEASFRYRAVEVDDQARGPSPVMPDLIGHPPSFAEPGPKKKVGPGSSPG